MHRGSLPVVAVILAGGHGSRAETSIPKQYVRVAGRSVLGHTLAVFERSPSVDAIIVVAGDEHPARLAEALAGINKSIGVAPPGGTRAGSTQAALRLLAERSVTECKLLVHDGARPLVDQRIIEDCVLGLDTWDAVDVVTPTTDTIVEVNDDGELVDIPARSKLRRGQTPQAFLLSCLRDAYERADDQVRSTVTDDCGVVRAAMPEVTIGTVHGSERNIKVTHPQDFALLDQLFRCSSTVTAPRADGSADLRGRVVVVLGGTRGIGAGVAEALRAGGAVPVVPQRAEGLDVRDTSSVRRVLEGVQEQHGRVDAVVVTAGLLVPGALVESDEASLRTVVETNIWGPVAVAIASHPFLARSRGQLLLFGSSSYTRGREGYAVYSASKAAVVNLVQALADEWLPDAVRVNCISPGRTDTDMRRKSFTDDSGAGDVLTVHTVAQATLGVLASSVTGSVVEVSTDRPSAHVKLPVLRREVPMSTAGPARAVVPGTAVR